MNGKHNSSGTSIADLRMRSQQNNIMDSNNDNDINNNNPEINSNQNNFSIEHLVSDINNSIDEFSPSDDKSRDSDFSTSFDRTCKKNKKKQKKIENFSEDDSSKTLYKYIKDPVIIIILYVFLSQDMIKNIIANYVPQINPSEETGDVTLIGIVIYGTILATLYMIIKYATI